LFLVVWGILRCFPERKSSLRRDGRFAAVEANQIGKIFFFYSFLPTAVITCSLQTILGQAFKKAEILHFAICKIKILPLTARRYVLVSVTRRQHRAESRFFSQKAVTVQGGYGALFAIQVQYFIRATRVAVQC
jgi:hypothetical protein